MTPWRVGRGWSRPELQAHLADLRTRQVNYAAPTARMTRAHGWTVDGIDAQVAREPAGPPLPDGPFARAKRAVEAYRFSDPRIVEAHFDPRAPLLGRDMLLEAKAPFVRMLMAARVRDVLDRADAAHTTFGFRYDTLEGHVERGYEWFLLTKDHRTGRVRFRIEAHWQPAELPTWWMRLGFPLVGDLIRQLWRRRAVARLRAVAVGR